MGHAREHSPDCLNWYLRGPMDPDSMIRQMVAVVSADLWTGPKI